MGVRHKKLTIKDREIIFGYLKGGLGVRAIAERMKRNPSTISRELRRNGNSALYSIGDAQIDRNIKASLKGRHPKLRQQKQPLQIIQEWLLTRKWSPEQIAGRLKKEFKNKSRMHVSHETIYKYIYSIEDPEERLKYINALRRKKRKRKPRKSIKVKRGPIANIISIHNRPKEVDSRQIPGHWEGDSIVGKDHKSAIGTLVERTSRYTIIVKYGVDKTSNSVIQAFAEAFNSIPTAFKRSLTFDRGAEMAQHELFTNLSGIPVYFADPGSPGQRGTNENTNGLVRQFFPKKTDFTKVSLEDLKEVERLLNERPRKVIGYKTPIELWNEWKDDPPKHQTPIPERGRSGGDLVLR